MKKTANSDNIIDYVDVKYFFYQVIPCVFEGEGV